MDLRTERTKRSIINAFIELRSKKPLEKITIKELSELALINKATFYLHYHDIYELSEQLENETVDIILSNISCSEELITHPKQTTEALTLAFFSQKRLIEILFSPNRTFILLDKLEKKIKGRIIATYPEYKTDPERNVLLTIIIYGGFYAYLSHSKDMDNNLLIDIIGNINKRMLT